MKRYFIFLWLLVILTSWICGCASEQKGEAEGAGDTTQGTQSTQPTETTPSTQSTQATQPSGEAPTAYVFLADLPEEIQINILDAAKVAFHCTEETWEELLPVSYLFGTFEDVYVFYELYGAGNDLEYTETVNDLLFWDPSSIMLCVYCDGSFYSLQEAFDGGILTADQLQEVYDTYYKIYPAYKTDI